MGKTYIYSLFLGVFLIFQLQVLSYIYWVMIDSDMVNGTIDKYLLLKTPLLIIPVLYILYGIFGFCIHFLKKN